MHYLDAILAFALTLAALATVVTIIMETGLRVLRMRKRNLVELMKLFDEKLKHGFFQPSEEWRKSFFESVVENPAGAGAATPYGGGLCKLFTWILNIFPRLIAGVRKIVSGREGSNLKGELVRVKARFLALLHSKEEQNEQPSRPDAAEEKFREFQWCRLGRDVYDKVSLEHVLRRLAETEPVRSSLQKTPAAAEAELDRLAQKFEELSSAISADFKRRAQIWSIFLGVVFAVGTNVDGLRIFDSYLADNTLSQAVISQQAKFESEVAEAEKRREALDALTRDVDAALKAIQDVGGVGDDEQNATLAAALDALAEETSPDAIQESAQRAVTAFADLESLGIPVGWNYYPACPYGNDDEDVWKAAGQQCSRIAERVPACKEETPSADCHWSDVETPTKWTFFGRVKTTLRQDPAGVLYWLLLATGTGLLIGLGAPFWFDVAKRLAEVRKMFSAKGSTEQRMSGKDANGDVEDRAKVVSAVVAGAAPAGGS